MYFNINGTLAKVNIRNKSLMPNYLENDIDGIAKLYNVKSISLIEFVPDNLDFIAMCEGEIHNEKKFSKLTLTPKLLMYHIKDIKRYKSILAHEIAHARNFEVFTKKIDYKKYLQTKMHILSKEDLFFCYGVNFIDEYIAFQDGSNYSPSFVPLLAKDADNNKDIFDYKNDVILMIRDCYVSLDSAKSIFLDYQLSFQKFIYNLMQVLSHRNEPMKKTAEDIISVLRKDKIYDRYITAIEEFLPHTTNEILDSLCDYSVTKFGELLFNVFTMIGINIIDKNGKYNFSK